MGTALEIRTDLASPARLRRLARRERRPRTPWRMLAIANAFEGMSRAEAARLAGMERQALRDAVIRYTATAATAGQRESPCGLRQKGLRDALAAAAEANPDKRIELWFMDEARIGQKGRTGFRCWLRGERPRGLCDRRFDWAYLFGAVRPATGGDFALVLPEVSTTAMQTFLDHFAGNLAEDAHAVLVLDQAGWHGSRSLVVPPNVTLAPLPPYAPELNPVERIGLFLRERFLSHRLLENYDAIVSACCEAWNALTPERLRSLCTFSWLAKVIS